MFFFYQYFSGDLLYIPLFWVVCVFEPGSDEEWRHLGFTGQRQQLNGCNLREWSKDSVGPYFQQTFFFLVFKYDMYLYM